MGTTNAQIVMADGATDPTVRHAASTALDMAGFARRTGTRIAEVLEQVKRDYPEWTLSNGTPPEHLA